jgi:hypothetical protein
MTPRHELMLVLPGQTNKHVPINDALIRLDGLVQAAVKSRTVVLEGTAYILPAARSGPSWAAFPAGAIAEVSGGVWVARAVLVGHRVWVEDERSLLVWTGLQWCDVCALGDQASAMRAAANLVMNPLLAINQRAFSGGALAAGVYGPDRWRAGPGGATLTLAADGTCTLTGRLIQTIEKAGIAGRTVSVSLPGDSPGLTVRVGPVSAVLGGSAEQRRCALFDVPGSAGPDIELELQAAAPTRIVTPGNGIALLAGLADGLPFAARRIGEEIAMCERYFEIVLTGYSGPSTAGGANGTSGTFRVAKRRVPSVSHLQTVSVWNFPSTAPLYFLPTTLHGFFPYRVATTSNSDARYHDLYCADADY